MFRFEHPEFFWTLAFVVLILLAYFIRKYLSHKDWSHWGDGPSNEKIGSGSKFKPKWLGLGVLGSMLLCIATVNPQWGFRSVTVENQSADLYLMMDISNSMLAEDIAPSRLERARRFALDFSNAFRTDKVGLILFAGNAYLQSPLTTDWHAIQLYINA